MIDSKYLTPKQIVEELDKYIVGQKDAKRNVAIALRNRWRRMNASLEMRNEIVPNNILLIGPTGVRKTEIARRLAKIADAPFIKVEASKFTEVGYVGRDVEGMVRDLAEQSVNMVKSRKKEEGNQEAPKDDVELNERTRNIFREKIRNGELEDRKIEIDIKQNNLPGIGM